MDELLGYFHLWPIMQNTAMNICVQVLHGYMFSFPLSVCI